MNEGHGSGERRDDHTRSPVLMPILDVKTRWSSTHQMLHETQTRPITVTSITYL